MLSAIERKAVQDSMYLVVISKGSSGINTRELIDNTYTKLSVSIVNLNKHHLAGTITWLVNPNGYGCKYMKKSYGNSIIAA